MKKKTLADWRVRWRSDEVVSRAKGMELFSLKGVG